MDDRPILNKLWNEIGKDSVKMRHNINIYSMIATFMKY